MQLKKYLFLTMILTILGSRGYAALGPGGYGVEGGGSLSPARAMSPARGGSEGKDSENEDAEASLSSTLYRIFSGFSTFAIMKGPLENLITAIDRTNFGNIVSSVKTILLPEVEEGLRKEVVKQAIEALIVPFSTSEDDDINEEMKEMIKFILKESRFFLSESERKGWLYTIIDTIDEEYLDLASEKALSDCIESVPLD